MTNINDEMKATADYTIKIAKEKFGQELDFSEQSMVKLENLLNTAYQSLSSRPNDEKNRISIIRTANAWGSYLGEYMRRKWGGTWALKNGERNLYIKNVELSPIHFVFEKITTRPETSLKDYLKRVEEDIGSLQALNQKQISSKDIEQSNKQIIGKKLFFAIGGLGSILILFLCMIFGFIFFNINNADFKSKLNIFLLEAEKLNVLTEQGVTYDEFRNQLIEVKSAYSSIGDWPLFYQDEKRMFDLAIKGWDYTLDIWTFKLAALGLVDFNNPDYEGIKNYLGGRDTFENLDEEIKLLMTQASIYFEKGKAGIR